MDTVRRDNFMTISFGTDGGVFSMMRGQFDTGFLGRKTVERFSDIRFDEESQAFDIWVRDGEGFTKTTAGLGFSTYDEARSVEVCWFENCQLLRIPPASVEGNRVLSVLRGKHP